MALSTPFAMALVMLVVHQIADERGPSRIAPLEHKDYCH
jgi:hypothetical protein